MTTDPTLDASGGGSTRADGVGGDGSSGKVDHSTYEKTVGEVKTLKQRLADTASELKKFQDAKREAEERKALEEKNFLTVIDQLRAEREQLAAENEAHKRDKLDFRKMNAAVGLLNEKGIQLESKYLGLLPIDQIIVDESGMPDKTSVAKVVSDFAKEHPRLTLPANKILPSDRPGNGLQKISIDEWKKLPAKEQVEALKQKRVQHDFGF